MDPNPGNFPLVRPGGRRRSRPVSNLSNFFHWSFCQRLFVIFWFLGVIEGGTGTKWCGIPGQPENGYLTNLHSPGAYIAGQRAEYQCSKGFTLLGNSSRRCQEDGMWSTSWPRCVPNLALGKPVVASQLMPDFDAAIAVDGQTDTCIYFDMRIEDRFFQIDLGFNQIVKGLVLHVPTGYAQEIAIFVAEKLPSSPGIQYRRCVNSVTLIREARQRIDCLDENGHKIGIPGRFIHIRDEKKLRDFYFSICEIEIFTAEESPSCGIPDQPAYGNRTRISSQLYEYSCQEGFVLDGARFSRCRDGRWQEPTPTCVAVECEPLTAIDHGLIQLFPIRGLGNYSFNTVAHYRCADGYSIVDGDARRTCGSDAHWTGTQPICQPVDCGLPRPMLNAVYQLSDSREINRTRPGVVARYTCLEGYVAQRIVADKAIQTMSVCQKNGLWRDVHFFCALQTTAPPPTTETPPPPPPTTTQPIPSIFTQVADADADVSPIAKAPLPEVNFIQIVSSDSLPKDSNAKEASNLTAIAAISIVVVFVLILLVVAGVAFNICRMRAVFDQVKKRVSLTSTNQLIASECPEKKGNCDCQEPKVGLEQVAIEPTFESEPVYNELDPEVEDQRSVASDGIQSRQTLDVTDEEGEERFYLDIEDSQLSVNPMEDICQPNVLDENTDGSNPPSLTPDEILQLYARIDKSKKKRNRIHQNTEDCDPVVSGADIQPVDRSIHSSRRKSCSKKILDEFHPNKVNDLHPRRVVEVSFQEVTEVDPRRFQRHIRWPTHVCGKDNTESRPLPPIPRLRDQISEQPVDEIDSHIYATLPTNS